MHSLATVHWVTESNSKPKHMIECKCPSSGSGAKQIYSHRVPRSIERHEQDSTIAPSTVIYVGIFSHWHRKSSPTIELSMQKTSPSRSWFDSCHFSQLTIQAPSFPQCPKGPFFGPDSVRVLQWRWNEKYTRHLAKVFGEPPK